MKRKAILLLVSLLAVSSMCACSGSGNVVPASSYVDYSFEEYTDPPTEPPTEPTEAPTEKPTQKKKEKASETIVNNKQPKSETTTEKPTEKKETATQKTTQQEQKEQPTNKNNQTNSSSQVEVGSFAAEDVSVIYDNRILTLDTEFNVVEATLGASESKVEYPNSKLTDNGEAYIYKYNNMKVYTYMKDNVEYVESVRVEDDGNATTTKGVDAGNSTADVKAKYGEPNSSDSATLKYNIEDKELIFYIYNDVVTSFSITRS